MKSKPVIYTMLVWSIALCVAYLPKIVQNNAGAVGSEIIGDVSLNERLDSSDAVYVLKHASGEITLTGVQYTLADYNKDNTVNTADATAILAAVVGNNAVQTLPVSWGEIAEGDCAVSFIDVDENGIEDRISFLALKEEATERRFQRLAIEFDYSERSTSSYTLYKEYDLNCVYHPQLTSVNVPEGTLIMAFEIFGGTIAEPTYYPFIYRNGEICELGSESYTYGSLNRLEYFDKSNFHMEWISDTEFKVKYGEDGEYKTFSISKDLLKSDGFDRDYGFRLQFDEGEASFDPDNLTVTYDVFGMISDCEKNLDDYNECMPVKVKLVLSYDKGAFKLVSVDFTKAPEVPKAPKY